VAAVARQLGIDDPGVLAGYRDMLVRWRHTAEIRDRYGYRDFTLGRTGSPSPSGGGPVS